MYYTPHHYGSWPVKYGVEFGAGMTPGWSRAEALYEQRAKLK